MNRRKEKLINFFQIFILLAGVIPFTNLKHVCEMQTSIVRGSLRDTLTLRGLAEMRKPNDSTSASGFFHLISIQLLSSFSNHMYKLLASIASGFELFSIIFVVQNEIYQTLLLNSLNT